MAKNREKVRNAGTVEIGLVTPTPDKSLSTTYHSEFLSNRTQVNATRKDHSGDIK